MISLSYLGRKGSTMFMRFLQLQIDSQSVSEFKNFYEATISPRLQKMHGCLFAGLITSNKNEFISLTFWESLEDAENYEKAGVFKNLFDESKPFLSESTEWKINLSENMELEYAPVTEEPVIKKYTVQTSAAMDDDDKITSSNTNLFVRIVSLKIHKGKLEEFKKLYNEIIIPELKSVKGCRHAYLIESINEENDFISLTSWDNKKAADEYESSGKFSELVNKVKHTFSQFYLWKMALEKDYNAKVQTTEDLKVEGYNLVTGKNFIER